MYVQDIVIYFCSFMAIFLFFLTFFTSAFTEIENGYFSTKTIKVRPKKCTLNAWITSCMSSAYIKSNVIFSDKNRKARLTFNHNDVTKLSARPLILSFTKRGLVVLLYCYYHKIDFLYRKGPSVNNIPVNAH